MTNTTTLQEAARRAYLAQSFRPEERGQHMLDAYNAQLNEDIEELTSSGAQPEQIEGYKTRFNSFVLQYFNKEAQVMSAMITGPARFPTARNQKRQRSVDNHLEVFNQWRARAIRSIKRSNSPTVTISGELQANRDKLDKLKRYHEIMKTFNAMMRKKAPTQEIAQACNLKIEQVEELLKPDFCGRCGFAQYQLTNNLATIKATEQRIQVLEAKDMNQQTQRQDVVQLEGLKVEINHQADRIQLYYDGKPDSETITKLKRRAFKWSPTNKCWQRKITANALSDTRQLLQVFDKF